MIVRQLLAVALLAPAAVAQQQPGCTAAEFRQFDFWAGEWDVHTTDGKPAGTNSVTRELKDCVLHEHWKGAGGGNGESFNMYNRATRQWHQTWVADAGNMLLLDGGIEGNRMVLSSRSPFNRITWFPVDRNHVRQLWESSKDDGKTWQTVFDGMYVRRGSP